MAYKRGQSGNPRGRPKGIVDRRTALRELLVPHAQELVNKTVELAKSGNTTALRLCLERIMAPIRAKGHRVCVDQPGTSLTERGQAIVNASLTARISLRETATLLQTLATQAHVIQAEKLEPFLKVLEEKLRLSR